MQITWLGHSCFKITSKDTTIVTDPYSGEYGLKPIKGKADIVTISHHHRDHDYLSGIMGDPLVFETPGAFEARQILMAGIPSYHDNAQGTQRGTNTIFTFQIEGIRVCHLGDLGHQLTDDQIKAIGDVDILLVPVGGTYTIDGADAAKVVHELDPRITIPMHYKIKGLNIKINDASDFLKEMGEKHLKPEAKLTVKKKQLPEEDSQVVLLAKA